MTVAAEPGAVTPGVETPAATTEQQSTTTATTEQPQGTTTAAAAPEVIGEGTTSTEAPEGTPLGDTFQYNETGDAALDVALGFIGSMGLGPDHPAVVAATSGDFTKLEAHLEAMGDKSKGWERYVNLAKDAHQRSTKAATEKQTAITAAVTAVAGDDKTWAAVKDWAGKNADPAEKDAINAMLAAGPVQARAAALMLTSLYREAGGTVVNPATVTKHDAGNGSPTNNGALSPAEFQKAVRELRGKLGTRMDSSNEYAALKARRMAWRG